MENSISCPQPDFEINAFRQSIRTHFKTLQKNNSPTNNIYIEKIELQLKQHAATAYFYKLKNIKTPMPVIIFHPGGGLALDMTEVFLSIE